MLSVCKIRIENNLSGAVLVACVCSPRMSLSAFAYNKCQGAVLFVSCSQQLALSDNECFAKCERGYTLEQTRATGLGGRLTLHLLTVLLMQRPRRAMRRRLMGNLKKVFRLPLPFQIN